jgi:hypothetical protein
LPYSEIQRRVVLCDPTFRRNVSPPSSRVDHQTSKKPAWSRRLRLATCGTRVPPKRQCIY